MNILFVTAHPAQVHHFNALRIEMEKQGHHTYWLATNKDISQYLLRYYGITYQLLLRPDKSLLSKVKVFIQNFKLTYSVIKSEKIDFVVSRIYPPSVLAAFVRRIPQVGISDTEITGIYNTIFSKFVNAVVTGYSFRTNLVKNQIRFKGNVELFYLHPNRFIPNYPGSVLGIGQGERYAVIRFVSWDAYHDAGLAGGFSDENKIKLAAELSKYVKVFISSEKQLPSQLEPYRISIPLEKMHHVLAYADLFIGESATMASESVVLGTPAIYIDEIGRGYTDQEAQCGLLFMFSPQEQNAAIEKAVEILSPEFDRAAYKRKYEDYMSAQIDPTAWMAWFISNFPESKAKMINEPKSQNVFQV